MARTPVPQELVASVTGEARPLQRRAIAKAITLLESTRADHRAHAAQQNLIISGEGHGSIRICLRDTL